MSAEPVPFDALLPAGDEKGCCASVYESEPVRWLLGESLHPGGDELTIRTAELAGVERGGRVLDVASGRGRTARLLASTLGADVVGVELGEAAVAAARSEAERAGLGDRVAFVHGDAESLPFDGRSFDAVICECSLCTFPDKAAAVAEMARVAVPGGRVAIADVTVDRERLPPPLRTAVARVACVADALPAAGYAQLLEDAGVTVVATERHDRALAAMANRVEARLRLARMVGASALAPFRDQIRAALQLVRLGQRSIQDGVLGYGVLVGVRDG